MQFSEFVDDFFIRRLRRSNIFVISVCPSVCSSVRPYIHLLVSTSPTPLDGFLSNYVHMIGKICRFTQREINIIMQVSPEFWPLNYLNSVNLGSKVLQKSIERCWRRCADKKVDPRFTEALNALKTALNY